MVRRLPVIQSKAPEDAAAEARPAWHWILIGAGFVVTLWAPLAVIAIWLAARLQLGAVTLGLLLLSYSGAAIAAGALVGRFGGNAREREATLAGLAAGVLVWSLAALGRALSPWPVALGSFVVLAGLGLLFARLGAKLGVKRRPRV